MTTFRPLSIIVCLMAVMQCAYCVIWYIYHHDIFLSIMTSSNRKSSASLSFCAGKQPVKVVSPHKGTVTRTFDVFVVSLNKLLNKHSIGRYFETPCNVLNWIVSTVDADGPTPIWHQDILNRHGEIGQLHIYRYANLFQNCPVASGASRKTVTLFNARELRNLWNHAFCKGVRWL